MRVQDWRKRNPGYWRRGTRKQSKPKSTLQDPLELQRIDNDNDTAKNLSSTLQDSLSPQEAMVIGLISEMTGCALQEDIVPVIQNLQSRGQAIFGLPAGCLINPQQRTCYEKIPITTRTSQAYS